MNEFPDRNLKSLLNLVLALAVSACAFLNPMLLRSQQNKRLQEAQLDYGKLPLSFEANQGQSDAQVHFLSRGNGYSLFLTDAGAVLALGNAKAGRHNEADGKLSKSSASHNGKSTDVDILRMSLQGANVTGPAKRPVISAEEKLPGKVNYFFGKDATRWHSDLPTYAKVRYSGVYPGVDLVYYGNQRQLEFDFVVAPAADADLIRLNFDGTKYLKINHHGDLLLVGKNGTAAFHAPVLYQQEEGHRQTVQGSFELLANNTVKFKVGEYDHHRELIIDPILAYSTYLGGTGENYNGDQANGITVDADGDAYIVGTTSSFNFPVTDSAYQTTNKPAITGRFNTVFVSKLNDTGTALVYSTFLGGSGVDSNTTYLLSGDSGNAIAIDAAKNVYITGSTFSRDFPVTSGAFQTTNNTASSGTSTGFVTKLNATGDALLFSTYLGGKKSNGFGFTPQDSGTAIAVDAANNVYVAGYTLSAEFPTTTGAFEATRRFKNTSVPNAFAAKLSSDGTSLIYSTYLGGSGCTTGHNCISGAGDVANGIAVDVSGNAYVVGSTYSKDFPTTSGAFQTVNNGKSNSRPNAFVTKLDPTGASALYSTYLGGSGLGTSGPVTPYLPDSANAVAVDSGGNVYVAGATNSTDFPVTPGVVGTTGNAAGTAFLSKLNATGSGLEFSTFVGGSQSSAAGVAIDTAGFVYIAGNAVPGNLSLSSDAVSKTGHVFVVKLNATATAFAYSTLLGGTGVDTTKALALDSSGRVYVAGGTTSTDFTVSSGAYQRSNRGADQSYPVSNAFVSALDLASQVDSRSATTTTLGISATTIQSGHTATLTATVTSTGSITPTGRVTFAGQFCAHFTDSSAFMPWTDCSAIASLQTNVNASGVATVTTPSLGVGLYTYTASYAGDTNNLGSNTISAPTPIQVHAIGPATQLLSNGGFGFDYYFGAHFAVLVTIEDAAGFPLEGQTVNFISSGATFTPASITTNQSGYAEPDVVGTTIGNVPIQVTVTGTALVLNTFVNIDQVPLNIVLRPESRFYGSPNPVPVAGFFTLFGSDTITLTSQTSATPASPVGTYPVTAIASGASLAHYAPVSILPTTLRVKPAQLNIIANSQVITYGQAPSSISGFTVTGFVNGETQSIVSGAPVLSTSVTSTTPVGYYKIQVGVGTLTAPNYFFLPFAQPGTVQVAKAQLTAQADHLTMPRGGPIPPLTYSFNGFVNGDTAAGAVTGAPVLRTTATTHSRPGNYPIYISTGSLASHNYHINAVAGVITILP